MDSVKPNLHRYRPFKLSLENKRGGKYSSYCVYKMLYRKITCMLANGQRQNNTQDIEFRL